MTLTRIAYVEDDADIQKIARRALERLGKFEVGTFSSGSEAVAGMIAFAPDLILLDVMMPGMDGVETLKQLRAFPALVTTPIVFMTAKVQASEVQQYLDLGAIGVIPKPFDPISLVTKVKEAWDRR